MVWLVYRAFFIMSDIATLREELKSDLHTLADDTTINRKIVSAMRFHRDKRLWYSERTFQFPLEAGKSSYKPGYGPPPDLVEIVGRELQVLLGGSESQRESVWRVPPAELDARRYEGTQRATPEEWDFYGNQLRLWPIPDSSTDQLYGRYVSDIGVPEVRWEAGVFKFYAPGGLVQLTSTQLDAFSNDWLDIKGGYHLIRTRTAYLLNKEFLRDFDAAEGWLTQWLEQIQQAEIETEKRTVGSSFIVGTILGDDDI